MKKILTLALMVILALYFTAHAWAEGETVAYPGHALQTVGSLGDVLAPSGSFSGKSTSLSGNSVTLNSGGAPVNYVMGAVNSIDTDIITGNQIFIKGGTVISNVFGGFGGICDIVGNSVNVSGGTVDTSVYGGYSMGVGNAKGNSVTVSGGVLIGGRLVVGGSSGRGEVTGNTVIITGGSLYAGVAGGLGGSCATNNTVAISGNASFQESSEIFGGRASGDSFSGNTLKLGIPIKVELIMYFEKYEFRIPSSVVNGGTVITVYNPVNLASTNIDITGIETGSSLSPGDKIILISNVIDKPDKINGMPYVEGTNVKTSDGSNWTFSASSGALSATLVSLPKTAISTPGSGSGGGGGCEAFGGFCILVLATLIPLRGVVDTIKRTGWSRKGK